MNNDVIHIYGQNDPAWVEVSCAMIDGTHIRGVLKVNSYLILQEANKPFHFWELRRLLVLLGYNRTEGLHKVIKQFLADWQKVLRMFHLELDDHFHYSAKAGRGLGRDLGTCTPEYEVSSLLFMLICLVITDQGRGARCGRAEKVLEQFFCMLFSSSSQAQRISLIAHEEIFDACSFQPANGICEHVAAATLYLRNVQDAYFGMTPQFVMASFMRHLFGLTCTCDASRLWLESILCSICEHIEKNFEGLENFKTDLLEDGDALVMHGQKKRRRIDVDLVNAIVGSPGAKVAATTGVLVRTHSKIYASDHKANELDEQYMLKHQASTWMSFKDARVVGLVFDAVRSGMPGVDNIVSIMTNPASAASSYMPLTDL